jgi:hypothetical protein
MANQMYRGAAEGLPMPKGRKTTEEYMKQGKQSTADRKPVADAMRQGHQGVSRRMKVEEMMHQGRPTKSSI